jgi:antitoxin component YwqK of YwqJK toxin-antitoxin module
MIKQLTFLLSLTFIFLFSGSVYGDELEVKKEFYDSGKLKSETHYKNGEKWGRETEWYKSGKKWSETLRTPKGFYFEGIKEKSDKLETTWWENGRLRTEFYFRGQSQTLWTWWFETGVKQSEERWGKSINNQLL